MWEEDSMFRFVVVKSVAAMLVLGACSTDSSFPIMQSPNATGQTAVLDGGIPVFEMHPLPKPMPGDMAPTLPPPAANTGFDVAAFASVPEPYGAKQVPSNVTLSLAPPDVRSTVHGFADMPSWGVVDKPMPDRVALTLPAPTVRSAFAEPRTDAGSVPPSPAMMLAEVPLSLSAPDANAAFVSDLGMPAWGVVAKPTPDQVALTLPAPAAQTAFATDGFDAAMVPPSGASYLNGTPLSLPAPAVGSVLSEAQDPMVAAFVARRPVPEIASLPIAPPSAYAAFGAYPGLVAPSAPMHQASTVPPAALSGVPLVFVESSKGKSGEIERMFRSVIWETMDERGFRRARAGEKVAYVLKCRFRKRGEFDDTGEALVDWELVGPNGRRVDAFAQHMLLFPGMYDAKLVPAISGLAADTLNRIQQGIANRS